MLRYKIDVADALERKGKDSTFIKQRQQSY